MTAQLLQFPSRGPFNVAIYHQDDAYLVVCRQHGWLHTCSAAARAEAQDLASAFGVAVVEFAP
jgi:hypothetical protein